MYIAYSSGIYILYCLFHQGQIFYIIYCQEYIFHIVYSTRNKYSILFNKYSILVIPSGRNIVIFFPIAIGIFVWPQSCRSNSMVEILYQHNSTIPTQFCFDQKFQRMGFELFFYILKKLFFQLLKTKLFTCICRPTSKFAGCVMYSKPEFIALPSENII